MPKKKMKTYRCPVCGFDRLRHPPTGNTICPSCGTEFNLDDELYSLQYLRQQWIDNHARWWSRSLPVPVDFDPVVQLKGLGYELSPQEERWISNDTNGIEAEAGMAVEFKVSLPKPHYKRVRIFLSPPTNELLMPIVNEQSHVVAAIGALFGHSGISQQMPVPSRT
jgi:hypothetical protein